MSQIGRGEDQAIQLDFGDNSISRSNHAAIVYDAGSKEFLLGHGGKSNIVRLNDKPVISNENLKTGDIIRIGDTALRFVALCDDTFNWSDGATEEDEDVAIA
jgi:pSer/pThr/pTyr-binding forkhead associated (FHA) protein